MTFAQFIKTRRLQLDITQEDFPGIGQSYLAEIEGGRKNPLKLATIEKLARGLRLQENQIDWLWTYSLLDCDPYERFGRKETAPQNATIAAETQVEYHIQQHHEIHIPTGASPKEVKAQLGKPDKVIRLGSKSKWSYYKEEVHVIFENDQATDIIFK